MTDTLNLSIDADQLARIQQNEAVVVRHWIGPSGRFAKLVAIGSVEECETIAATPGLLIVHEGLQYDGEVVVPTSELLPPAAKE